MKAVDFCGAMTVRDLHLRDHHLVPAPLPVTLLFAHLATSALPNPVFQNGNNRGLGVGPHVSGIRPPSTRECAFGGFKIQTLNLHAAASCPPCP